MTNLQFVKNEIKRYNKRHDTEHTATLMHIDVWENFVSVMMEVKENASIGYAKRNPNCDEPNERTGISIATFRALKRIDGRSSCKK